MISVVGLGIGDSNSLATSAKLAIQSCQLVIGSTRQRKLVQILLSDDALQAAYPSPLNKLQALLEPHHNKHIVILASGDPLYFGIGDWLSKHIELDQLCFYPNISSIQAAFSRIKQSWQDAKVVSLHGRPLVSLRPHLRNHRCYAILTDKNSSPQHIAQELQQLGFAQSILYICESLGTDDENIQKFNCDELTNHTHNFHPLHITLLKVQGNSHYLPEFPGIEDKHFETGKAAGKGMITKKQVRLAALSLLQTQADEITWDVGAGCGGLAVEWAYWHPHSQLYAIEHNEGRYKYLKINQQKFGVTQNLTVITDSAPQALHSLPAPSKVFIGGSDGNMLKILDATWQRLQVNGCIVISCVTEDCKYEVMQFIQNNQLSQHVEQLEIATSNAKILAGKQLLRPQLPVRLIKINKEATK